MKINLADVPVVLVDYMETNIMPKASPIQKFGVGAAMFLVANRATQIVNNPDLLKYGSMIGIIDEKGLLDMEILRTIAMKGYEHSGSFTIAGYTIDQSDIDGIYNTAKKVQVSE